MPSDLAPASTTPRALLSAEALLRLAPACPPGRAAAIAEAISREAADFGVSTPRRLAHFLAQVAHESAGFTRLEEALSYTAERLTRVWPTRFPTLAAARPFAGRPFALAERVYGGRLGNVKPGDGWRYRGRGLIQITGRETYAQLALRTGLPLEANPTLAAEPGAAARIALAYWRWKDCDAPADADDLEAVTRRINGGLTGLEARARWLARARLVAGAMTAPIRKDDAA